MIVDGKFAKQIGFYVDAKDYKILHYKRRWYNPLRYIVGQFKPVIAPNFDLKKHYLALPTFYKEFHGVSKPETKGTPNE